VLGLAVTAALLVWVLHDVHWNEVAAHLGRANIPLLFAAAVVATLTFPIRTARWRLMLRDAGGGPLPWAPLWHGVAVGFMANNLLPARAGEFARAYVAGRQLPVRYTTAFASIAVERVLDGLTLLALLAVPMLAPSFPREASVQGMAVSRIATGLGIMFGAALVVAVLVVVHPAPWLTLLRRVSHALLPARFADRVTQVAEGLIAGLAVLKTPGRLPGVVAWSLALWLVNAASFWVGFRALGVAAPVEAALMLQGLIAFGVAIPAGPGFFGVFEALAIVALGFYGVPKDHAVTYAVAYHLSSFIPITLLGLYSLSRVHVGLGELRAARATEG
jgi:uncharacterized protein (TIRG00374 family)